VRDARNALWGRLPSPRCLLPVNARLAVAAAAEKCEIFLEHSFYLLQMEFFVEAYFIGILQKICGCAMKMPRIAFFTCYPTIFRITFFWGTFKNVHDIHGNLN